MVHVPPWGEQRPRHARTGTQRGRMGADDQRVDAHDKALFEDRLSFRLLTPASAPPSNAKRCPLPGTLPRGEGSKPPPRGCDGGHEMHERIAIHRMGPPRRLSPLGWDAKSAVLSNLWTRPDDRLPAPIVTGLGHVPTGVTVPTVSLWLTGREAQETLRSHSALIGGASSPTNDSAHAPEPTQCARNRGTT